MQRNIPATSRKPQTLLTRPVGAGIITARIEQATFCPVMTRFTTILLLGTLAVLLPAGAVLQPAEGEPETPFPCTAKVEVLDSGLEEMLASAVGDVEQKKISEGAEKLWHLFRDHGDALVRLKPNEETYAGVREVILQTLAENGELLDAYNRISGAPPAIPPRVLAQLDVAALAGLAKEHPPGGAALRALELLAQHFYESQQYEEAKWALYRLERLSPPLPIHLQVLRLVCAAESGDIRELEALASAIQKSQLSAKVLWRGSEVSVAEVIDTLRKSAAQMPAAASYNPLFPDYAGPGVNHSAPEKMSYSSIIPAGEALGSPVAKSAEDRHFIDSYPTAADGLLYLRTRGSLYAARLSNPGKPLWRKNLEDDEKQPVGEVWTGEDGTMRRIFPAIAVRGKVYTLAPAGQATTLGAERYRLLQLVCLDAASGRILWQRGGVRGEGLIDRCYFAGAPAVAGKSVFAVAILPDPGIGESYYLVRLDSATGAAEYAVRISTTVPAKTADVKTGSLYPPAPPYVKGGIVYVATNAGVVGAFDALFGKPLWITRYDQTNSVIARSYENRFERAMSRATSFAYGPMFEENGRLFAAPAESDRLIALESKSGRLLWSLDNSARRYACMLGVRNGALLLSGDKCAAFDCATGKRLWKSEPDVPSFQGKGFIAGENLLIPTRESMLYFCVKSGRLEKTLALSDLVGNGLRDVAPYSGTLLHAGSRTVAVSNNRLTIYDSKTHDTMKEQND
ncbi:MAG: PQQ-binding-like beta-propeller repeat protein [Planctomycetota bacterium]